MRSILLLTCICLLSLNCVTRYGFEPIDGGLTNELCWHLAFGKRIGFRVVFTGKAVSGKCHTDKDEARSEKLCHELPMCEKANDMLQEILEEKRRVKDGKD